MKDSCTLACSAPACILVRCSYFSDYVADWCSAGGPLQLPRPVMKKKVSYFHNRSNPSSLLSIVNLCSRLIWPKCCPFVFSKRDLQCVLELDRGLRYGRKKWLRQDHTGSLGKSQESFLTDLQRPHLQSLLPGVSGKSLSWALKLWQALIYFHSDSFSLITVFMAFTNKCQQDECLPAIYQSLLCVRSTHGIICNYTLKPKVANTSSCKHCMN